MEAQPTLSGQGFYLRTFWQKTFRQNIPKSDKMIAGDGCFRGHYFEQLLIFHQVIPPLEALDPSDDISWGRCDRKAIDHIRLCVTAPFAAMTHEDQP